MNVLKTTFQAESKGNLHGTSAGGVSNIHNTELSITAHILFSILQLRHWSEYCCALCLRAAGSDGFINHTNTSRCQLLSTLSAEEYQVASPKHESLRAQVHHLHSLAFSRTHIANLIHHSRYIALIRFRVENSAAHFSLSLSHSSWYTLRHSNCVE
jgi:hypothetical protein